MKLIPRRVAVLALALALTAGPAGTAFAWSNGPSSGAGFGTHDWVMQEADSLARSRGVMWIDTTTALAATDDPDTVLHDTWYHGYDIWGTTWGNSPLAVANCYSAAVSYLRAGDTTNASRQVGLLSHYYSDTCNPLHTDQSTAEDGMHSSYESAVDDVTTSPGVPGGWVVDDGYVPVTDPAGLTRTAASVAHPYHDALVGGYIAGGLPAVQSITRFSLDRAANGTADMLCSITQDAGVLLDPSNVPVYRFYNIKQGVHFYTASGAEKADVIVRLSSTYRFEGVAYTLHTANPANNTPLYRFYNFKRGVHFYTASEAEKNNVVARLSSVYRLEGVAYRVCSTPVAGATPVYRFYNVKQGVHFYTASETEKANVVATLSSVYRLEGVGYYLAP